MEQEYVQLSATALKSIVETIRAVRDQLEDYSEVKLEMMNARHRSG
jgi:hypothetical protein